MDPTPERFRRLARSAPYRWRSLLLVGTWGPHSAPARVHVAQPDLVRVEELDGVLQHEVRQGSVGGGFTTTSDGREVPEVVPPAPLPVLDADGLVTTERRPWHVGPEVPMWQDYRFVAVLDPYELSVGVDVLEVAAVEHGGRPAWEALLRPGEGYEPRCACCPLLPSLACDLVEGVPTRERYADAHRVRLDVATGVCVSAREVGGPDDGSGHALEVSETGPGPRP